MIKKIIKAAASLNITIFSLSALFILVIIGTLKQVELGIYQVQELYFRSFFIVFPIGDFIKIPIFPGGKLLSTIIIVNLSATIIHKKLFTKQKIGLFLAHSGLLFLFIGGALTSYFAIESQLVFEENETKNYSESFRDHELAISSSSSETEETIISIPEKLLLKSKTIAYKNLPFTITILDYFKNSKLNMKAQTGKSSNVTHGIGTQVTAKEIPIVTQDKKVNIPTLFAKITSLSGENLGVWMISKGLGMPQTLSVDGKKYTFQLQSTRYYTPYSLTLLDFTHDVYPGTTIPKNFSSLVSISDSENTINRESLIYMNHPLRFKGKTYYQASFGKNDTLSILQVVENPAWLFPYISCIIISLGLLIHFIQSLQRFRKKKNS